MTKRESTYHRKKRFDKMIKRAKIAYKKGEYYFSDFVPLGISDEIMNTIENSIIICNNS